jgi:hypothetical protein
MYQAIQTKFLGPTNTRGARVKATADAGSVIVSWDHAIGIYENHKAAAVALARRFGWPEDIDGGSLPGSGFAFICRREPPALLAALRAMLTKHDDRDGASDLWPREAAMAREAIATAGG